MLVHHHDKVGHPGFQRTLARLQEKYFWVSMKNDVARHVKNCRACAWRKSPKNMKRAPLHPIEVTRPLEIIGVDFVGPLPTTEKGNKYIMTMQDHFTRWPAAYASPEATAKTVVEGVQSFARDFGFPDSILSDRGSSFVSKLVKKACKKLKIFKRKTTAYRPETNVLCERFHGTMKAVISVYTNKGKNDWDLFLDDVVTAYHTTPHTVTKETPAFLMFGRQFKVPPSVEFQPPAPQYSDDFLTTRLNNLRTAYALVRKLKETEKDRQKVRFDKKSIVPDFKVGESAFMTVCE